MTYFVGIDGGGTSCRVAIADIEGRVLGVGTSGPANLVSDFEGTIANIVNAADAALCASGLDRGALEKSFSVLGLAGHNLGGVRDIRPHLPFTRSLLRSDVAIALRGAFDKEDGGVGIIGTGTMYMSKVGGIEREFGGWGFPSGDQGGGAHLGQLALQYALLGLDEIFPLSPLLEDVLNDFNRDGACIVHFIREASPAALARFAPRVFACAERGDPAAREIVRFGSEHVQKALRVMTSLHGCEKLCLLGGLSRNHQQWFGYDIKRLLVEPKGTALDGAVAIAIDEFRAQPAVGL